MQVLIMPGSVNDTKPDAWRKLGLAATIAGVLVTTIGIAVTIWLSLRTEIKKSASFVVLGSQPFVVSEPSSSSNFRIFYKHPLISPAQKMQKSQMIQRSLILGYYLSGS
jgi:hypothetical protein